MLKLFLLAMGAVCAMPYQAVGSVPPDVIERHVLANQTAEWTLQYDTDSEVLSSINEGLNTLRSKQGIYAVVWDVEQRLLTFTTDRGVHYSDVLSVLKASNLMPNQQALRVFMGSNPR